MGLRNRPVEGGYRRGRVNTNFLLQKPSVTLEGAKRVGSTTAPVEGSHQKHAWSVSERLHRDVFFKLGGNSRPLFGTNEDLSQVFNRTAT
jgi:hypothetical protein